jgi:hypothetical protein
MSLINQDAGSGESQSQNDAIAIAISPALLSTSAWMTALGLSLAPAVTTGIARFSYVCEVISNRSLSGRLRLLAAADLK